MTRKDRFLRWFRPAMVGLMLLSLFAPWYPTDGSIGGSGWIFALQVTARTLGLCAVPYLALLAAGLFTVFTPANPVGRFIYRGTIAGWALLGLPIFLRSLLVGGRFWGPLLFAATLMIAAIVELATFSAEWYQRRGTDDAQAASGRPTVKAGETSPEETAAEPEGENRLAWLRAIVALLLLAAIAAGVPFLDWVNAPGFAILIWLLPALFVTLIAGCLLAAWYGESGRINAFYRGMLVFWLLFRAVAIVIQATSDLDPALPPPSTGWNLVLFDVALLAGLGLEVLIAQRTGSRDSKLLTASLALLAVVIVLGTIVSVIKSETIGAGYVTIPASDSRNVLVRPLAPANVDNELWVVDVNGGTPRRLTENTLNDLHPSWSPNSEQIVFEREGDLFIMNAEGDGEGEFVATEAYEGQPAWSPDGSRIAFVSDVDGDRDIFVANVDGSGILRITENDADDLDPAWSPDGTRLAITRDGEIFLAAADGSSETRIVPRDDDKASSAPAWAPSGRFLALTHGDGLSAMRFGEGQDQPLQVLTLAEGQEVAWSPSGDQLVFVCFIPVGQTDRFAELCTVAQDRGLEPEAITNQRLFPSNPDWSADGGSIVFSSQN